MDRLAHEGIRGADLVYSCIGPALELFSRYPAVETPDGESVGLGGNSGARSEPAKRGYLSYVWEVVGRTALARVLRTDEAAAQNGGASVLEEDARLTALFLWTLQSTSDEIIDLPANENQEDALSDEDEDDENSSGRAARGYTLVFDVVRRFAQPLGIELPKWEGRVIETKKGVVRLLPLVERSKRLFGDDGARAVAAQLERDVSVRDALQGALFPEQRSPAPPPSVDRERSLDRRRRGSDNVPDESLSTSAEATTLDRVHAAMLLQNGGSTNALRTLINSEQERGPDFLRLANALSALYPPESEEKRLLDAMLITVPR
jgi:hypothetical protein